MQRTVSKLAIKLGDAALAQKLIEAGYRNPRQIRDASDAELAAIPGIGRVTVAAIRKAI